MKVVKIIVDVFMLVFIVLSVIRWDGEPTFHVIVGCGFALFFVIHFLLNMKPFIAMSKKFKTLKSMIKLQYIVDLLLIIVWSFTIITGLIAIVLYSETESIFKIGRLHGIPARIGCGLALIHFIQHLKQIRSYLKRKK